jgi:hypothetical protein
MRQYRSATTPTGARSDALSKPFLRGHAPEAHFFTRRASRLTIRLTMRRAQLRQPRAQHIAEAAEAPATGPAPGVRRKGGARLVDIARVERILGTHQNAALGDDVGAVEIAHRRTACRRGRGRACGEHSARHRGDAGGRGRGDGGNDRVGPHLEGRAVRAVERIPERADHDALDESKGGIVPAIAATAGARYTWFSAALEARWDAPAGLSVPGGFKVSVAQVSGGLLLCGHFFGWFVPCALGQASEIQFFGSASAPAHALTRGAFGGRVAADLALPHRVHIQPAVDVLGAFGVNEAPPPSGVIKLPPFNVGLGVGAFVEFDSP